MKVLIVARCKQGRYAPFIVEQVNALQKQGVDFEFFPVTKRGLSGYLSQVRSLKKAIIKYHPDLIHAHYGLCGLLANLQRRVPVVTTYHGSDINDPQILKLSKIAIRLSKFNIFVSQKNIDTAKVRKNYALIPCGINLEDYPEMDKVQARKLMGLAPEKKYVLFAGAFDNAVKNAPLAFSAMALVPELLELKGYTRSEVATLMNAVDCFLMTSHTEGSPQVIKEALACGCPIVSVDVGDVRERVTGIFGCFLSETNEPKELAYLLWEAISFENRTNGQQRIVSDGLDNVCIAQKLSKIYTGIINNVPNEQSI